MALGCRKLLMPRSLCSHLDGDPWADERASLCPRVSSDVGGAGRCSAVGSLPSWTESLVQVNTQVRLLHHELPYFSRFIRRVCSDPMPLMEGLHPSASSPGSLAGIGTQGLGLRVGPFLKWCCVSLQTHSPREEQELCATLHCSEPSREALGEWAAVHSWEDPCESALPRGSPDLQDSHEVQRLHRDLKGNSKCY